MIIINDIDDNNNAIINENNFDNNYLTSSSSQSTLIINIATTSVTTQVNNDFCNIYKAIGATTNLGYLNVILVERFDTISATVNIDYLSIIMGERFSTNGETAEASYNYVIREEKHNSNGETNEENNDFFDDIGNSRWCDGQSTITPRGGVNKQRPLLPWLKCLLKRKHRGRNTTTTTMVAMTTDTTVATDDHAWTNDSTTLRLQNQPILEHPSEAFGFNKSTFQNGIAARIGRESCEFQCGSERRRDSRKSGQVLQK